MKKYLFLFLVHLVICNVFSAGNFNLMFDGHDDYVYFDYQNEYNIQKNDFTIELELTAFESKDEQIFISNEGFSFGLNKDGQPILYIGQNYVEEGYSLDLRDEKCHHVAVIRKSGKVTFYIDGSEYSTFYLPDFITAHSELIVGASLPSMDKYYFGFLDNLRWWNSARTKTEINDFMFSCVSTEYKDLILNLHLNEGQGQIAHDYSWLQNHGILGKQLITQAEDPEFSENVCQEEICCKAVASFQSSYNQAIPNYLINFTNISQNAQNYEWYIDGMYQANNASFSYSFTQVGEYVVSLKAYNSKYDCYDYYSEIITIIPSVEFDFCGVIENNDQALTECECFDGFQNEYAWIDRFGNRYCNIEIQPNIDCNYGNSPLNVLKSGPINVNPNFTCGYFKLYYKDIWEATGVNFDDGSQATMEKMELICQVFADVSELINNNGNDYVYVRIKSEYDASVLRLASAGQFYNTTNATGILYGETWKAINLVGNNPNFWDAEATFNFAHVNQFYSGYNPNNIPPTELDLYTVTLHEVLHALGFASFIQSDGSSVYSLNGSNFYSSYDENLQVNSGNNLIAVTGGSASFAGNGSLNGDLYSGCNHLQFNGNNTMPSMNEPVYSPSTWEPGSSISHFDDACSSFSFVMHPNILNGNTRQISSPETNALCDLGYSLTSVFGTNNILTTGDINLRSHTVNTCGVNLIANDDLENCLTSDYFIFDLCNTNQTEVISFNEILCNDVWTGNTPSIDFVFDPLSQTNLTLNSNSFSFSPPNVGIFDLFYRLVDVNGNVSNVAKITIHFTPCNNNHFNCSNTIACNQIDNPSFDIDCSGNIPQQCNFPIISGNICSQGLYAIPCWLPFTGSPDIVFNDCNPTGGFASSGPNGVLPPIPYDNNNTFARILGRRVDITPPYEYTESFMTEVNIESGKQYIISYHTTNSSINPNHYQGQQSYGVSIYSDNYSNFTFNFINGGWNGPSQALNSYQPPLNSSYILYDQLAGNHVWSRSIHSFQSFVNQDLLYFANPYMESVFPNIGEASIGLDLIEFIEDEFPYLQTNYTASCGETIIIGQEMCTITNMRYNWFDVTDSQNPVQLTEGNVVLSAGQAAGVLIPNNSNGSQLQIEVNGNKVYEIQRIFYETNGVPIVRNNADDAVQISVTLNDELLVTKTEISGNSYAGGIVTYEVSLTNQIGADLVNFVLQDELSIGNFDLNSLNFTNLPSGVTANAIGNLIDFTVNNLVNGGTITFEYSVDLDANLQVGDLVENCISYNYFSCSNEVCEEIEIENCNIDATFTESINCNEVTFTSTSYTGTHTWDFGDGNTSNDVNPVHDYQATGTYNVTHIISENGCTSSEQASISISTYFGLDLDISFSNQPTIQPGNSFDVELNILNNSGNNINNFDFILDFIDIQQSEINVIMDANSGYNSHPSVTETSILNGINFNINNFPDGDLINMGANFSISAFGCLPEIQWCLSAENNGCFVEDCEVLEVCGWPRIIGIQAFSKIIDLVVDNNDNAYALVRVYGNDVNCGPSLTDYALIKYNSCGIYQWHIDLANQGIKLILKNATEILVSNLNGTYTLVDDIGSVLYTSVNNSYTNIAIDNSSYYSIYRPSQAYSYLLQKRDFNENLVSQVNIDVTSPQATNILYLEEANGYIYLILSKNYEGNASNFIVNINGTTFSFPPNSGLGWVMLKFDNSLNFINHSNFVYSHFKDLEISSSNLIMALGNNSFSQQPSPDFIYSFDNSTNIFSTSPLTNFINQDNLYSKSLEFSNNGNTLYLYEEELGPLGYSIKSFDLSTMSLNWNNSILSPVHSNEIPGYGQAFCVSSTGLIYHAGNIKEYMDLDGRIIPSFNSISDLDRAFVNVLEDLGSTSIFKSNFSDFTTSNEQNTVNFQIYPNPTNNLFTIEFETNNQRTIMIKNQLNQTIQSIELQSNKETIDLSNQSVGVYFIVVKDGDNTQIKKIVKHD